jgi:CRISPR system Cascade subunit CasD
VIGLLCAALGRPREASLDDFFPLRMVVRVDREGRLMRDYHTAQNVRRADPTKGTQDTVLSERFYLADAEFLVGLEGESDFLTQLDTALRVPVWPLFLGRKAFVPSLPISEGVIGNNVLDVLTNYPWRKRHTRERPPENLRYVGEVKYSDREPDTVIGVKYGEGEPRSDVPRSFTNRERKFGVRHVLTQFYPLRPQHVLESLSETPDVSQQTVS